MAAPTATARLDPAGLRLLDGYRALYTFARRPAIALWEIEVTPPGVDGGEAIDTTTMHNDLWRTKFHRSLQELTDGKFTCAYDPAVLDNIVDQINAPDVITVTFRDGSTWAFHGYLRMWEPDALKEGEMPTATATITPTDEDTGHVERGPAVSAVAGT
jgi:hypothetical protein